MNFDFVVASGAAIPHCAIVDGDGNTVLTVPGATLAAQTKAQTTAQLLNALSETVGPVYIEAGILTFEDARRVDVNALLKAN